MVVAAVEIQEAPTMALGVPAEETPEAQESTDLETVPAQDKGNSKRRRCSRLRRRGRRQLRPRRQQPRCLPRRWRRRRLVRRGQRLRCGRWRWLRLHWRSKQRNHAKRSASRPWAGRFDLLISLYFPFLLGKAPFLLRGPAPGWNKVADARLCPLPNGRGGDQGEPPQPISAKAKPAALPMTAG